MRLYFSSNEITAEEKELFENSTEKEITVLIYQRFYLDRHLSGLKIAKIFNVSYDAIYKLFRKYGLKTRNCREMKLQYTCDSDFFETIDTEEKAYWLGFLYADGFIQKEGVKGCSKKVGLTLAEIDKPHIEKFKAAIKSNAKIGTYKVSGGYNLNSIYSRVILCDPKLVNDLIQKGCCEHKTDILKFPTEDKVPRELLKHFIRGYFDGDGSLSYVRPNIDVERYVPSYKIRFTGTDNILTGIMNEFMKNDVTQRLYPLTKRKPEHTVLNFEVGGNIKAYKIAKWLYKDATVYLDRKYQRYLDLEEYITNKGGATYKCA